ncbi:hypothetical protein G9P44_004583 [Scheffersomyces stipitis]|nr:hypothetical protein G9P44_004583 [Scheffersomyces stipitis]
MDPTSGGRRASRRLRELSTSVSDSSQHSSSAPRTVPSKRSQHQAKLEGHSLNKAPSAQKKRKTESTINRKSLSKSEKLARIITNFNLSVNELFHLREYQSIVSWNPSDFSTAIPGHQIPELFEIFTQDAANQIEWDANVEDLSSIPLRLQKKVLAEREKKLLLKYPFKNDVIDMSKQLEREIISRALEEPEGESHTTTKSNGSVPKPQKQANGHSKTLKSKKKVKQKRVDEQEVDVEIEDEEEDPDDEINTNYRLKAVKYTIAPPLVTHPSHIPAWRPEISNADGIQDGSEEHQILEFNPEPITVVKNRDGNIVAPNITSKLHNYLESNYKVAIVDDSNVDYNNTAEEFEVVTAQQENMLKEIYHKCTIDNSLELNGDKIERRKIVLPQTSNLRQTSDPFRNTATVTPKVQGSTNNLTHHDYLLNQGISFAKLHQQMRKQHSSRTKRIAQMVDQYFKRKNGEKDRLARERELNLKKLSRLAAQAVKKRWTQANKVYSIIQQQKEDELKQIQGREHLSQMLEHSTQLLEAQFNKSSREATTEPESDSDSESVLSNSDENFSTSDESEQENSDTERVTRAKDGDMSLSVEELKQKYSTLQESVEPTSSAPSDRDNDSDDDSEEEEDGIVVSQGLSALYGGSELSASATPQLADVEYTEEQKKLIEELNTEAREDPVLNSDSESSGFSSEDENESGSDESETVEEDDEEEEKDVPDKKENGYVSNLGSLFNGRNDASEEEEEGSYSESDGKASEDEMMSTTDEESDVVENGVKHEDEDDKVKEEEDIPMEDEVKQETEEGALQEINGAKVKDVPLPSLLRGTLRPYQKQGLNWLASLYNNDTNGILADEMGLGKTIQTISLLSYLACEHHIWGPHLIVVPTSVMLNWEMEFKKFAPGFKVMTYYGSPQQRAQKRKGWNNPDTFHVCITSYQLVVQDQQSFKRRKWRYMILDEAHNIKNFRSTRWRALLNFNTENRLLLTGTPLQNNLMELWSLLYFLMPSSKVNQAMPEGFANLDDFQTWFGRPVDKILEQTSATSTGDIVDENEKTTHRLDDETRNTVARLHQVLRPYLLRRLKKDVEKQMPGKYEHIVYCRLSKRQRFLYDDFMSRAKTKETLASGNFLSIINCLMQLRKVCNHPDLFEVRPIVTSLSMPRSVCNSFSSSAALIRKELTDENLMKGINFNVLNLDITNSDNLNYFVSQSASKLKSSKELDAQIQKLSNLVPSELGDVPDVSDYLKYYQYIKTCEQIEVRDKLKHILYLNSLRCSRSPIYGESLLRFLTKEKKKEDSDLYDNLFLSVNDRVRVLGDVIEKFSVITPAVVALDMKDQIIPLSTQRRIMDEVANNQIENPFHKSQTKLSIAFPDKSLLQYDCGKLQKLAKLLQNLTAGGHRALIFTQMTKVLDILEQFLNIHGYRYSRLDGATKIEDRQLLTEKFNRDPKISVFILSTRSGGLGINLTGADTVIFYDSDWNPAMDKQCQDRCHRIGQSRDVHIYRFVSEYTIESNILKKANQKRQLDNVVIQEGEFTTDYFGKFSVRDLVNDTTIADQIPDRELDFTGDAKMEKAFAQVEDEDDRTAANEAMKEVAVDDEDFDEESKSATTGGTPAQTPGPEGSVPPVGVPAVKQDEPVDVDYEEGIGHIDEYMLRFIADGYYND